MVYAFVQIPKCMIAQILSSYKNKTPSALFIKNSTYQAQTDKITSTTYYYANFVTKLSLILHHLLSNFGFFFSTPVDVETHES